MLFFKWVIYFRCKSHLFVDGTREPRVPGEVGVRQTQETDLNFPAELAKGREKALGWLWQWENKRYLFVSDANISQNICDQGYEEEKRQHVEAHVEVAVTVCYSLDSNFDYPQETKLIFLDYKFKK